MSSTDFTFLLYPLIRNKFCLISLNKNNFYLSNINFTILREIIIIGNYIDFNVFKRNSDYDAVFIHPVDTYLKYIKSWAEYCVVRETIL